MKSFIKSIIVLTLLFIIPSCHGQQKNGKEELKFSNGNVQFENNYKNGVLNGPYKAFYESGKLRSEGQYLNGYLNGIFKTYTKEGRLATEEEWKSSSMFYQKIFWQPIPFDDQNFLFVSDTGFVRMKNGRFVTLDKSTPDNIMEDSFEGEIYIWKNGEKKSYK
jgi:hypothetical protein